MSWVASGAQANHYFISSGLHPVRVSTPGKRITVWQMRALTPQEKAQVNRVGNRGSALARLAWPGRYGEEDCQGRVQGEAQSNTNPNQTYTDEVK